MTNPYHKQSEQREARTERKKQTDNIQISKETQDMHSIENQSQQERVNQIANLKEQVQTGTYFVDAGKLAEKTPPFYEMITASRMERSGLLEKAMIIQILEQMVDIHKQLLEIETKKTKAIIHNDLKFFK